MDFLFNLSVTSFPPQPHSRNMFVIGFPCSYLSTELSLPWYDPLHACTVQSHTARMIQSVSYQPPPPTLDWEFDICSRKSPIFSADIGSYCFPFSNGDGLCGVLGHTQPCPEIESLWALSLSSWPSRVQHAVKTEVNYCPDKSVVWSPFLTRGSAT